MAEAKAAVEEVPLEPMTLEKELQRNPEMSGEDIALLRDWACKQPHLPPVHDRELALFLHSCYFSSEAAKTALETYFTARTHLPEFFANRDPLRPDVRTAAAITAYVTLPNTTPEGYKVMLLQPADCDADKFNHADVTKIFTMVVDLWLLAEGSAPGHVILFDMNGLSFAHFTRLSLTTFKKIFFYLQEALPFRLKGLHFFNVVPFMDKMMAMMKPFMKKEMYEVMHVHPDGLESLLKFVPQDILPEDYGGSAPTVKKMHERMLPLLEANRGYFLEEEQRKVDEAQRAGRARSADELFGVEGTFKKLDID